MNRIPALDGLRGIAIALVLFDHIQDSLMRHYFRSWTSTGYSGVTLFFVLSGFLITSKLLEGPTDFRRFYLRRFFRLMPAAWTYLAVLLLLTRITGRSYTTLAEVRACIFFYRNFIGFLGLAGHFWSLSVEEQFYLVWPATLFLAGITRCRWIALLGAIGCSTFRWFFWGKCGPVFPAGPTFLHADGLLVGSSLALLITVPHIRLGFQRWSKMWALPALIILLACMCLQREEYFLLKDTSIAALIATATLQPASLFARILSFQPLAWLGTVSYSLYAGVAPAPGVTPVDDPALAKADLTINSNVLEPRQMVRDILASAPDGGLVYLEVPCEAPFEGMRILRRIAQIGVVVLTRPSLALQILRPAALYMMHEHINYYSEKTITTLMRSAGGAVIASGQYRFSSNPADATRGLVSR